MEDLQKKRPRLTMLTGVSQEEQVEQQPQFNISQAGYFNPEQVQQQFIQQQMNSQQNYPNDISKQLNNQQSVQGQALAQQQNMSQQPQQRTPASFYPQGPMQPPQQQRMKILGEGQSPMYPTVMFMPPTTNMNSYGTQIIVQSQPGVPMKPMMLPDDERMAAPKPPYNMPAQQTVSSRGYSGMPPTSYQNTMTMNPVPTQRPPSEPGMTAPQPKIQKRERKILSIIDPNTGKDLISDVISSRSTPPKSTGSRGQSPTESIEEVGEASAICAQFAALVEATMRLGGGGQHSAQMLCTEVLPPGVQPHHLKQTAPVMEPQSQPPIVMKDTTNSISQQQPIVITPHVSAPQPLSNRSAQQTVRSGGYSGMPPTSYQNTMTMHPVPKKRPPSAPGITAPQPFTQKREREILYIVDPNTGKDIISDVMSTRSTPPASTGSGSRGRTPNEIIEERGTSPPQGEASAICAQFAALVDATMRSGGGRKHPALKPSEVLPPGVQPHHLKQTAPVMELQSQPPIVMKDTTNSISQQQPIVITPHVSAPQPLSNRSAQQTVSSGGYSGMPPTSYQNTMTMHPVPKKRPPSAPGITAPQPFTQKRERKILYIVDPNTGKDIISDVMSTRSTPPASTGSGSRGRTPNEIIEERGTSPPQGEASAICAQFAALVDATMRSGGGRKHPALKPSTEVLPPGVQPHHLKQTAPVMEPQSKPPIVTEDTTNIIPQQQPILVTPHISAVQLPLENTQRVPQEEQVQQQPQFYISKTGYFNPEQVQQQFLQQQVNPKQNHPHTNSKELNNQQSVQGQALAQLQNMSQQPHQRTPAPFYPQRSMWPPQQQRMKMPGQEKSPMYPNVMFMPPKTNMNSYGTQNIVQSQPGGKMQPMMLPGGQKMPAPKPLYNMSAQQTVSSGGYGSMPPTSYQNTMTMYLVPPQGLLSVPGMTAPQPVIQKRERKILSIIDHNTGKDIRSDVMSTRSTPPGSTGSGSRGQTSNESIKEGGTSPPQDKVSTICAQFAAQVEATMRSGGGGQHYAHMLSTEVLPPGVQPHHLEQTAPVIESQSQPQIVMKDTTNSISQQQPIVITPRVSAVQLPRENNPSLSTSKSNVNSQNNVEVVEATRTTSETPKTISYVDTLSNVETNGISKGYSRELSQELVSDRKVINAMDISVPTQVEEKVETIVISEPSKTKSKEKVVKIEYKKQNPVVKSEENMLIQEVGKEESVSIDPVPYSKVLGEAAPLMETFGHSLHTMHTEPETHGSIPAIILRMDNESIEIYKKALESGSEIKHDIRIIIVGKKGAGKTSLVRNLLKENLDNVDSTNGIDIHVKRCKIRTADGKWFLQEGSFISDVSQRMLRSMIIQTRMNTFPENERNNEYGEEFEEEDTANQSKDTHDLNIVEEATDYVQRRNIQSLTKVDELVIKQKSSNATDNQHDIDLREMIDSARDMDDEEYASLSFWDFAGDREFYNTHQTFLSEEAIYLVVTKLNETDDETNETLKFWFDSIHFYGTPKKEKHEDIEQVNRPLPSSSTGIEKGCIGNSSTQIYDFHDIADSKGKPAFPAYLEPPIIAIGTHKDQCMRNFKDQLVNQIKNNLGDSAARQHLRNCHYISNTTNDDNIFEALRQNIYEIAKSRQGFGKLMPVRFIQLEKYIDRKLQAGTQFLSFGDLKALAEKIGAITDIGELDVFLRYHHDFGNLIYFIDIPEYIILNPQWLANVFCILVTADKFRDNLIWHNELETYETTGKLTENLLHCIFENQSEGIIKCKKHILKIMEKFDIIVRPRMLIDGEEKIDDHYYVPCMIKSVASKNIQNQLNPQQKSYCLCLQFNFLPPAFINHVIISCIRKYPTSQFREEKKNPRPALFRHTGLFDIQCCKKLLVASFNNFIQFQIWKYDCKCQTSSKQIGKILLEQVDQIIHESYGLFRISYDVKMKCESTSYDCFDGLIKPIENGLWYFCYEHNGTHIYRDDCFSEHAMTKKTAECQTEQENTIIAQKKDEDRFCFEIHVQKNTNKVASSAEEMNMAKMVKVALNILADVLFDLLKLETYGNPAYLLQSRKQCDITFLYGEHRRMNKHKPSNSSKRHCPWGGEWTDIAGTDNALGDDIERIRLTRNELQHMKFFALDDTRYTELCTILQDVLKRFDKHINPSHLYTDRLNEILKNTVEREDVECFKLEIKSKL